MNQDHGVAPQGGSLVGIAPGSPAPAAILPHLLVVHGLGELIVTVTTGLTDVDGLHASVVHGVNVYRITDGELELSLDMLQGHAHVGIPPGWLDRLRFDGSGHLVLRGWSGVHLDVVHTGAGTLELERLAAGSLTVDDQSIFLTRLSGQVDAATVRVVPGPGGVAASQVSASSKSIGYCDCAQLTVTRLTASVDGGACLRLHGHAAAVTATLGTGFIDAAELSVDRANITVTGSGQAVFGDLGALDVSCTGSGTVRWAGNPVLGHVTTSP